VASGQSVIFGRLFIGLLVACLTLAGLVFVAPAPWWAPLLQRSTDGALECRQWFGSLWSGGCARLYASQGPLGWDLGRVAWQLERSRPWLLPTTVRLGWQRGEGWLQARISPLRSDGLLVSQVRSEVPIEEVMMLLPPNWTRAAASVRQARGFLRTDIVELFWPYDRPGATSGDLCARGTVELIGLRLPAWPEPLGLLKLTATERCDEGFILQDHGGPVQIRLVLDSDDSQQWRLSGTLSPRRDARPEWKALLGQLGPMTPAGAYPVDLTIERRAAAPGLGP
jgi:hypothetical protein